MWHYNYYGTVSHDWEPTLPSQLPGCTGWSAAHVRVELGDNTVCRMAHKGAEDTSDVASCEGDNELRRLAEGVTRIGHHIAVEKLDSTLKGSKLHHSVGNLPQPKRRQALVEATGGGGGGERPSVLRYESTTQWHSPSQALLPVQHWSALPQRRAPANTCLHTHLHRLHGGKGNVCKELCTGRGSQVEARAVAVRVLLGGGAGSIGGSSHSTHTHTQYQPHPQLSVMPTSPSILE